MSLPTFITVLFVGVIVGVFVFLVGKGPKLPLPLNLGASIVGALTGGWVLGHIHPAAIHAGFALGGSLTLLALLRALKK